MKLYDYVIFGPQIGILQASLAWPDRYILQGVIAFSISARNAL